MSRIIPFFTIVLFACMACNNAPEKAPEPTPALPPIQEVFAQYHEERLGLFPLDATYAGDNRFNDLLPNGLTIAFREKLRAFYQTVQEKVQEYDREALSAEEKISYDILLWESELNLEELKYPMHLLPLNQFQSLHLTIGQLAGGTSAQPFETVQDYDNWLSRLDAFSEWLDSAKVHLNTGIEQGIVLPKSLTMKVIPQMEDLAEGPAEQHLFYAPINSFPESFEEADKIRITDHFTKMIDRGLIPRFEAMVALLKGPYLEASRESSGIAALPFGKDYYDLQIKKFTTTNMTADAVFALGESEVERISGEMEKVMAEVGFEGDLKAFFDHVRTKKELMPFTQPGEVIANFNDIHKKMQPNLDRLFDLVPKTAFEVRRTEAFREASASAEYHPGSVDGTRPGIFFVPIPSVKNYNVFSDEDLFLHEAIPGHHYQISLQQENQDLPAFRRTLWYSSYGEGWALYSESLGKELGLYEDPYQYFGMLSAEMHRAIRLVVDVGLHTKGWTREQAIQYSLDHEAESEASVVAEIERYMSWPGQALSYKVGQLKILELRAKAEATLGADFDIKAFHNILLESGCVPLQILEMKVDSWVNEHSKAG